MLHNPDIKPRLNLSKESYTRENQTTLNHFHEKLLKLKALMKTQVCVLESQPVCIVYVFKLMWMVL